MAARSVFRCTEVPGIMLPPEGAHLFAQDHRPAKRKCDHRSGGRRRAPEAFPRIVDSALILVEAQTGFESGVAGFGLLDQLDERHVLVAGAQHIIEVVAGQQRIDAPGPVAGDLGTSRNGALWPMMAKTCMRYSSRIRGL